MPGTQKANYIKYLNIHNVQSNSKKVKIFKEFKNLLSPP